MRQGDWREESLGQDNMQKNYILMKSKCSFRLGSGEWIRTADRSGMNRLLWPTELRRQMVAGEGFEPLGLRVMSPTSYQTALPRDIDALCSQGKMNYSIPEGRCQRCFSKKKILFQKIFWKQCWKIIPGHDGKQEFNHCSSNISWHFYREYLLYRRSERYIKYAIEWDEQIWQRLL